MLICYLDDSGTDDQAPVLTMAGYIGTMDAWRAFEREAKKIFDEFGVKVLHGKDFDATRGEFKKWPRRRKEQFAARLYWELRKAAEFGVVSSVKKTAHARAKSLGEAPQESAYGHCFRNVLDTIMRSAVMKLAASRGGTLSFVVEAGNKNDRDVLRIFNEERWSPRHTGIDTVLKSVSFASKESSIALQMADFLAFHARRHAMKSENARKYLPLSDFQRIVFQAIPTAVNLSFEFRTNEEIEAGIIDPQRWRNETPWL